MRSGRLTLKDSSRNCAHSTRPLEVAPIQALASAGTQTQTSITTILGTLQCQYKVSARWVGGWGVCSQSQSISRVCHLTRARPRSAHYIATVWYCNPHSVGGHVPGLIGPGLLLPYWAAGARSPMPLMLIMLIMLSALMALSHAALICREARGESGCSPGLGPRKIM